MQGLDPRGTPPQWEGDSVHLTPARGRRGGSIMLPSVDESEEAADERRAAADKAKGSRADPQ